MPALHLHFLGRLGNAMFTYAFARAFAERNGLDLFTDPWIGQQIFQLEEPPCRGDLPRKNENDIKDGDGDISFRSYCQQQKCLDLYSRSDCKRWFQLRPEVARRAAHYPPEHYLAHHRKGDYHWDGSAYPVVGRQAYFAAKQRFAPECPELHFISEEEPLTDPHFTGELAMVPDFLRLMNSNVLFRANSSFSWWAATLSDARIFSPVCAHLHGGQVHDNVEFVEGNAPRLAPFEYTTDLRLRDK